MSDGEFLLIAIAIPLLPTAIAVAIDLWTRRGYGLALLAFLLLSLIILVTVVFVRESHSPGYGDDLGIGAATVIIGLFLYGSYCALVLVIGALVEAGKARQWRWLVGLIAAEVMPWLLVLVGNALGLGAIGQGTISAISYLLALGLPILTVLAYGVYRIVPSEQPTITRQAAPVR